MRTCTTLAENPSLILSTPIRWLINTCSSSSKRADTAWPLRALSTDIHTLSNNRNLGKEIFHANIVKKLFLIFQIYLMCVNVYVQYVHVWCIPCLEEGGGC